MGGGGRGGGCGRGEVYDSSVYRLELSSVTSEVEHT